MTKKPEPLVEPPVLPHTTSSSILRWDDQTPVFFDMEVFWLCCEVTASGNAAISPGKIAQYILSRKHFVTIQTEDGDPSKAQIRVYDSDQNSRSFGLYRTGGRFWIEAATQIMIGPELKSSHVSEVVKQIQRQTFVDQNTVDSLNIELIPVGNGILNTVTRELQTYGPEHVFLSKWTAEYDPDASTAPIEEYMRNLFTAEDIPAIQEFVGWCLERSMARKKSMLLVGPGDNGKTYFLNIVRRVMGNESTTTQGLKLGRFDTAEFYHAYASMCDDLPNLKLSDSGKFKELTGNGRTKHEKKFKDPFYFISYAKLFFASNYFPQINDNTDAHWDRWLVAKMPHIFVDRIDRNGKAVVLKEDEQYKDYSIEDAMVESPAMKSAWLNYMLAGLARLRQNGQFSSSLNMDKAKAEWQGNVNSFLIFAKEKLVRNPKGFIIKEELREAYLTFCEEDDWIPMKDLKQIKRQLKQIFPKIDDSRPTIGNEDRKLAWKGISFKVV